MKDNKNEKEKIGDINYRYSYIFYDTEQDDVLRGEDGDLWTLIKGKGWYQWSTGEIK